MACFRKKVSGCVAASLLLTSLSSYAETTDRWLPFWGNEARAMGYDLPEPFGVSASYMQIRQDIKVKEINFENLMIEFWGISIPLPADLFLITAKTTKQRSHTENIKLDTWVFPFMNIYGILGQTKGHSLSKVDVDADPLQYVGEGFYEGIAQAIHELNLSGDLKDIDFRLDFKGKTYGGGITLAGGSGNFFALLDANYTWTRFDILDGNIKAFIISPRLGYRFTLPESSSLHLPSPKLNIWIGSMYQNIQQDFRGGLSNLQMPPELHDLIEMADSNGFGRFQVKQELEKPWNLLIGLRYEPTPHFALTTELGFEDRESIFVSGEFRF